MGFVFKFSGGAVLPRKQNPLAPQKTLLPPRRQKKPDREIHVSSHTYMVMSPEISYHNEEKTPPTTLYYTEYHPMHFNPPRQHLAKIVRTHSRKQEEKRTIIISWYHDISRSTLRNSLQKGRKGKKGKLVPYTTPLSHDTPSTPFSNSVSTSFKHSSKQRFIPSRITT